MAKIGEPVRTIEVEPIQEPLWTEPTPAPETVPAEPART